MSLNYLEYWPNLVTFYIIHIFYFMSCISCVSVPIHSENYFSKSFVDFI